MTNKTDAPSKARRGFAAMTPAQRSAIASAGGRAAHAAGTAHEWSARSAAEAGRKGGLKTSADRERMAELGRRGGQQRGVNIRARKAAEGGE